MQIYIIEQLTGSGNWLPVGLPYSTKETEHGIVFYPMFVIFDSHEKAFAQMEFLNERLLAGNGASLKMRVSQYTRAGWA